MFDVRTANIVCLLDLYRSEKNLLKSGHIITNLKKKTTYIKHGSSGIEHGI